MKTKFLLIMLAMVLVACNKDDDNQKPDPQEERFDIHNPEGYFLYAKESGNSGRIYLFEFLPEEKIQVHTLEQEAILSYTVIDDNIIDIVNSGVQFIFDGNIVTSNNNQYDELVLIKKPESNQLANNIFGGSIYRSDGSQQGNLFCRFTSDPDEVFLDFGYGATSTNYATIGNIATKLAVDVNNDGNNDDNLFIVLVNGKLEANITDGNSTKITLFAFDLNIADYMLFAKEAEEDGSNSKFTLFDMQLDFGAVRTFVADDVVPIYSYYKIIAENTIELLNEGTQFVLNENAVLSNNDRYKELVLVKKEESNQLAGKTFAGTYYNADMTVLHPNFFYAYHNNDDKYDAGFEVGTALRTETYTSLGNIASVRVLDNQDVELMVLVNGKLEVNYYAKIEDTVHYGSFTKQ
ncbi:MAG: hypothetical protein KDC62_09020 [Aequorivita sp.]|nr:hypothetical protein [Aequorivita sp.]